MKHLHIPVLVLLLVVSVIKLAGQSNHYKDVPFLQDKSEKHLLPNEIVLLPRAVAQDRNGKIQVVAGDRLLYPFKNKLVADRRYRWMQDLSIRHICTHKEQFFYLTDRAVFSNAWAGRYHWYHSISDASIMSLGQDFDCLVVGKDAAEYLSFSGQRERFDLGGLEIRDIISSPLTKDFLLVSNLGLHAYSPGDENLMLVQALSDLTSIEYHQNQVILGSRQGLLRVDPTTFEVIRHIKTLPWLEITALSSDQSKLWVGTTRGAFSLAEDESINYYASKRWLPDDHVQDLHAQSHHVAILTASGLAEISFQPMTLHAKALHFEDQVRQRHIRHGFNTAEFILTNPGDLSSGHLDDSDNDGLWTSMYLASQLFRYHVTQSSVAYQNAVEAFEAMERLYSINPLVGFPARSYERHGYARHDQDAWHQADNPVWDWKGTTSSDEAVGHFFAFALCAEIIPDQSLVERAITLIKRLTDHILDNDLYLVDVDGKPTRWGRWHPDYVNGFPEGVGDRKLNSSNILAFLQTAYHFTGEEKYRQKAYHLIENEGYLTNLMKPMAEIGVRQDDSLSALLSSSWNHSDDEMYFLSYWNLYPYAFNDDLKEKYREAIRDHWDIERPEKDGLWNLCYAMTGAEEFDLKETIWYLQEFPMDLINYSIENTHRKDIQLLEPNFRRQTTVAVLPPDEKPIFKHNTNTFTIDRQAGALRESSGDIFLLPYWMGRYLGVISGPSHEVGQ